MNAAGAESPEGREPDGREPESACGPGCACTVGNEFGEATARGDLRSYRKSGPAGTTRWLLEGLSGDGVSRWSISMYGSSLAYGMRKSMNEAFTSWPDSSYAMRS